VFTHFPRWRGLLVAAMVLGSLSLNVAGHEIPADVTIQALLKPEGHRLRVLVRVPLVAMRDFNYPTRGDRAAGILDVSRADLLLRDAAMLWVAGYVEIYEGDTLLPPPTVVDLRVSLPSDKSFGSYEEALAHVTGPRLPDDIDLQWSEGLLDILFEYRIQSDAARFSVQPGFDRLGLRTYTTLRLITSAGTVRAFEFAGNPGLVRLDPEWSQVVRRFVASGVQQLIEPTDLALFLVCLVLPFRRLRPLAAVAAAFGLGYSVTLLASSYGLAPDALWFAPLVSTLVAASILYVGLANIVRYLASGTPTPASRVAAGLGFGLIYGFAFSFTLQRTLQFAGAHALAGVLSFNAGIAVGQIALLLVLAVAFSLLFRYIVDDRSGTIVLSAIVAHTAWHWTWDRWGILRQFRFEWPAFDLAFWALAMRWAMVIVALGGFYWLIGLRRRDSESLKSEV